MYCNYATNVNSKIKIVSRISKISFANEGTTIFRLLCLNNKKFLFWFDTRIRYSRLKFENEKDGKCLHRINEYMLCEKDLFMKKAIHFIDFKNILLMHNKKAGKRQLWAFIVGIGLDDNDVHSWVLKAPFSPNHQSIISKRVDSDDCQLLHNETDVVRSIARQFTFGVNTKSGKIVVSAYKSDWNVIFQGGNN